MARTITDEEFLNADSVYATGGPISLEPESFEAYQARARARFRIQVESLRGRIDNSRFKTDYRITDPFCEKRMALYLDQIEAHGQHMRACREAGVPPRLVKISLDTNEEFADAVLAARGRRSERIVQQIEEEALAGHYHEYYDKNGRLVRERKLESGIRAMMLKRHDEGYRDKLEISTEPLGVIYAPPDVTLSQWKQQVASLKELPAAAPIETTGDAAE